VRHGNTGKKLGRDHAHRKALYSNLAGALIEHGRIKTTITKAKAVKPIAEQMITLGRRGDLHARRQAVAFLRSKDVVHKLFAEIGPRFADRPGGYSRIIKLGPRAGDAAEMVYLELLDEPVVLKERAAASPPEAVGAFLEPDEVVKDAIEDEATEEPELEAEADAEPEPEAATEVAVETEPEVEAEPEAVVEDAAPEAEAAADDAPADEEAEPEAS
jgi:large subunit ribosomal protein L17